VSEPERQPIGVILAGGAGSRIGGDKAIVALAGRPLISYPLQAMRAVTATVAVVAKPDTRLPECIGAEVWIEPAEPRHPLAGILHALRQAGGSPVLVCAADMPLITPAALRSLATADADGSAAVIATAEGGLQPQLGLYMPGAAALLEQAAQMADRPLRAVVAALGPRLIALDERLVFNVNTPADLARAEEMLAG
jgi:molybdopterin-guanine dinucleotide biosynthesis protein A